MNYIIVIIILVILIIASVIIGLSMTKTKTNITEQKKETFFNDSVEDERFNSMHVLNSKGEMSSMGFPDGMITPYHGDLEDIEKMDGWVICDGTNGTPDLRGRFVRMPTLNHKNQDFLDHNLHEKGGSDEIQAEVDNLPPHRHNLVNYEFGYGIHTGNSVKIPIDDWGGGNAITVRTDEGGRSNPDAESNEPPYSTVYFIMKKANKPRRIKYGSAISLKTASDLFLGVDSLSKELQISLKAIEGSNEVFTIERARIKDSPGVHNSNETYVKYNEPIYIKSKITGEFLYRGPDKVIRGLGSGDNTQSFRILSWRNKTGYVEEHDQIRIHNSKINNSYLYTLDWDYKVRAYGNGDKTDYSHKFTIQNVYGDTSSQDVTPIVTDHNTGFNDECNGNAICLDRHNMHCPTDTSLTQFNLNRKELIII